MKKLLFSSLFVAILIIGCTKDEAQVSETTSDLTLVTAEAGNPQTMTPNRAFDNSRNGLYHGLIVTQDISLHAKIWINIANDGNYNATVGLGNVKHFTLQGVQDVSNESLYQFSGDRGSFTFDVSDFLNPEATNVTIDNTVGYIETVKDRSTTRAAVALGTYVDFNDAAFNGTWDLMTDGTANADAFGLPNLTQVCVLSPNGGMFVDDVFETFNYPCFGLEAINPVFHAAGGAFGNINEFWAQDQTANWGGVDVTYSLGQSTSVHNNNPQFIEPGFHNNNFANPPVPGCSVFENGLQAIWFWDGRVGSATFVDAFAPPPPPPAPNENPSIGSKSPLSNPGSLLNSPDLSVFE